jgi:hypothetical protein
VLGLSNGLIATTSTGESVNSKPANFKLRFWDPASGLQVGRSIEDHRGSLRSIAALPSIDGFATTANDGCVMLRTIDGDVIETMQHPLQGDGAPTFVFGRYLLVLLLLLLHCSLLLYCLNAGVSLYCDDF